MFVLVEHLDTLEFVSYELKKPLQQDLGPQDDSFQIRQNKYYNELKQQQIKILHILFHFLFWKNQDSHILGKRHGKKAMEINQIMCIFITNIHLSGRVERYGVLSGRNSVKFSFNPAIGMFSLKIIKFLKLKF